MSLFFLLKPISGSGQWTVPNNLDIKYLKLCGKCCFYFSLTHLSALSEKFPVYASIFKTKLKLPRRSGPYIFNIEAYNLSGSCGVSSL